MGHDSLGSPFHRTAEFCGTCHDVSNAAFSKDEHGVYQLNAVDAPAPNFSPHPIAPVERTYSEWLHSEHASSNGVYALKFAGNRPGGRVSICQHCHMAYASGYIADTNTNPSIRPQTDIGVHDPTGGTAWIISLFTNLYPGQINPAAVQTSIGRALRMLTNAATLAVPDEDGILKVTGTNECGHKLPTGYPEGRRIWLNVKFYDEASKLLAESSAYDFNTGVLTRDAQAKIYEVHSGFDTNISRLLDLDPAGSLHFVLNNKIYEDNRIPPRGFSNETFTAFGGAPVGHHYDDGPSWDATFYTLPERAVQAVVRLYYQSISKEFIEFLRDENPTDGKGQEI